MLKATILFASVPVSLAFAVPAPVLPEMAEQFGGDPAGEYLVKMILGILGVAMALGAPIAGYLTDKLGRRPILAGSGLVFAAAGVAPFVVESLPTILVTRFLVGMAAAAFATVGAAMVGDHFDEPEQRARWIGLLLASSMVASVVAAPLSGLLGEAGWRWPFLIYLSGLPITAVAWLALRQPAVGRGAIASAGEAAAPPADPGRFPMGFILLGLLAGVLMYVPGVYAPFRLRDLGVESPSVISLGITINVLFGALLAGQFGRARQRYSARGLFCWSFGVTGLGVVLLALAPSYQWAFVGLFVMGVGSVWLYPNMLSLVIAHVGESRRGRAVGLLRSAQSIAPALGLSLFEPVVARFGVHSGLLVIAAISAALFAGAAGRLYPFNAVPSSGEHR